MWTAPHGEGHQAERAEESTKVIRKCFFLQFCQKNTGASESFHIFICSKTVSTQLLLYLFNVQWDTGFFFSFFFRCIMQVRKMLLCEWKVQGWVCLKAPLRSDLAPIYSENRCLWGNMLTDRDGVGTLRSGTETYNQKKKKKEKQRPGLHDMRITWNRG